MVKMFRNPVLRHAKSLFVGDLAIIIGSIWAAAALRLDTWEATPYILKHVALFMLQGMVYILCFIIADLYDVKRDFRRLEEALSILATCFLAMVISIVIFYSQLTYIGRGVFAIYGMLVFMFTTLMRSTLVSVSFSSMKWKHKVLIVGAGQAGRSILNVILAHSSCWLWVVGFIDDDPKKQGELIYNKPVLGASSDLLRIALANDIDMVVAGITHKKNDELIKALIKCHYQHITVTDMPSVYESITGKLPLRHIDEEWLLRSAMSHRASIFNNLKRTTDILLSLLLLIIASPVLFISAILIKLDSRGEVFFRQERVGRDYYKFNICKFRTMVHNAEAGTGAIWASKDDPRMTRVGKVIRKLRIDELPQLFNVLKGDMSFVGPRPERDVFIKQLEKTIPFYGHRLVVKPGITGWAQVMYPYAATVEEAKEKLRYDLYYIKNMSIMLDTIIVLKTIKVVLTFKGH